ncbi:MAG: adenosylhomocysteinase [Chloroflexota bacterium]|nr:adenosylhomocysteinase [Chloroflexota bacterium]
MTATTVDYDIVDIGLAEQGRMRSDWAERQMPVLQTIRERFAKEKPLAGLRIAVSLHITTETAVLLRTLKAGGAEIALCASNPLSTRDDVCATLVAHEEIPVYAYYGEDVQTYYRHVDQVLAHKPQLTMDDGADLIVKLHEMGGETLSRVIGGMEETTTGVIRVRSMERNGILKFPVVAVNDTPTKRFFDNRYGTGQNTVDGILRATNILIAGKVAVVAGYGWVGRGIALRLKGMGANVIVTEVSPIAALEAVMEGYRVMPMAEAVKVADIIVSATGGTEIVSRTHFADLKEGVLLCNSGHFDVEIDVKGLKEAAVSHKMARTNTEEYLLPTGQRVYLLAEGRLVGQAAAEASPASVMDMSFADQALATEWLVQNQASLEAKVYNIPTELDLGVAKLKLSTLGIMIDELSTRQNEYNNAWQEGT